jgi:hypothetical protein
LFRHVDRFTDSRAATKSLSTGLPR